MWENGRLQKEQKHHYNNDTIIIINNDVIINNNINNDNNINNFQGILLMYTSQKLCKRFLFLEKKPNPHLTPLLSFNRLFQGDEHEYYFWMLFLF